MKHLSLATRYRPQNFAQVAGQDMVKAVLSRAAAEDRPAAAYLLSGTRGVGKTTIARIFAKTLNCKDAPCPEPCNQCEQCRKITQGAHVDVAEIDGASNNGVDDARALRENIGYAPMEGRYKVFIIDEAHMLSRAAFNALLKTLEEPPERVVFIFATTEANKFPITIVSRCQHFVFRHLSEDRLVEHLSGVLHKENMNFEPGAVRLIARRAAGSVRDGMSLLDQTLALGGDILTEEITRQVLGLAGQDLFAELFGALQGQNCAAVASLCRRILQEGVDIGFFVRELAGNLRTLFLLRQCGQDILPSLHLPDNESTIWQKIAPNFSTAHLHAAWQMALDAQQTIGKNPEPSAALELLLLNLALLPRLLPVGQASMPLDTLQSTPVQPPTETSQAEATANTTKSTDLRSHYAPRLTPGDVNASSFVPTTRPGTTDAPTYDEKAPNDSVPAPDLQTPKTALDREAQAPAPQEVQPQTSQSMSSTSPVPPLKPGDWQAFCEFCSSRQQAGHSVPSLPLLRNIQVKWTENGLYLHPKATTQFQQLQRQREELLAALEAFGVHTPLEIVAPPPYRSEAELIEEYSQRPELRHCLDVLKAQIKICRPEN